MMCRCVMPDPRTVVRCVSSASTVTPAGLVLYAWYSSLLAALVSGAKAPTDRASPRATYGGPGSVATPTTTRKSTDGGPRRLRMGSAPKERTRRPVELDADDVPPGALAPEPRMDVLRRESPKVSRRVLRLLLAPVPVSSRGTDTKSLQMPVFSFAVVASL